ncbi:amidase domain-containing protein [Gorillibacterium massiliense]|uniref:amidase domain-containing protein n=1 Tax=Gorillibacterium massiliense TaxID=1280390 RepID=UPI0004AD9DD3|nr:amidase domain-containing protein [Gorillibacterium massiliense]
MDWKTLLYEYAYNRNRMEADGDLQPLAALVFDEGYLDVQNDRLRRIGAHRRERGVETLRRESRLAIARNRALEDEVVADIRLSQRWVYRAAGRTHTEERIESEQLVLSRKKGGWRVESISPDISESGLVPAGTGHSSANGRGKPSEYIPAGLSPSVSPLTPVGTPYLNGQVITPGYGLEQRAIVYDRQKAAQYADRWWETFNPAFLHFEVDCTNYVSQCIFAGGAPMNYTGKRESGWWYHGQNSKEELWSFSWAVADSLRRFLSGSELKGGLRADRVESPKDLAPGDVIAYSWDGGRYGHSTFVTDRTADGMPLVNAHTVSSKHRYWDYRDSYAWTPNTKYAFFHIHDSF